MEIVWTAEERADPRHPRLVRFVDDLSFPMVFAFDEVDDDVIDTCAAGRPTVHFPLRRTEVHQGLASGLVSPGSLYGAMPGLHSRTSAFQADGDVNGAL